MSCCGVAFFVISLLAHIIGYDSLLIRVRTRHGTFKRLEINQTDSNAVLFSKLQQISLLPQNGTLRIGDSIYSATNVTNDPLYLAHGDLVSISQSMLTLSSKSHTVPMMRTKGRAMSSMSDIIRRRDRLPRYKADLRSNMTVNVFSDTGRILRRLARHGGLGIALGTVNDAKIWTKAKDPKIITNISVSSVYELASFQSGSTVTWSSLSSSLEDVISLASDLGLSVGGCVIGQPGMNTSIPFSNLHLLTLLRLQNITHSSQLMCLR